MAKLLLALFNDTERQPQQTLGWGGEKVRVAVLWSLPPALQLNLGL